ncbi:MAG: type II toxin-antitoxin system prevent-host-death family antitoxin [Leptospiraceae bacterium]|nr:type II toxin-antitoxin system prevent-host-death family antitoxin [Leptospiraceae bacterium]
MNNYFNVAQAKSKFSEVLHRAEISPQFISSRGKEISVILSKKSYEKLLKIESENQPRTKLKDFLQLSKNLRSHFPKSLPTSSRKSRSNPDFS